VTITIAALFLGALMVAAGVGNWSLTHLLRGQQVTRG
jgi:hypothetical protein